MEALRHPWFSESEDKSFPLTMFERKLMDKMKEGVSKSLKMLLANQQLVNFANQIDKEKENKKKPLAKTQQNPKLSLTGKKDKYNYTSHQNMLQTSSSFRRTLVARKTEDLAKSFNISARNTIKRIN